MLMQPTGYDGIGPPECLGIGRHWFITGVLQTDSDGESPEKGGRVNLLNARMSQRPGRLDTVVAFRPNLCIYALGAVFRTIQEFYKESEKVSRYRRSL
jgi:hypothetical protein